MEADRLIDLQHRGEIGWLTIDRAAKANAMTLAMAEALTACINAAAMDGGVKALVITGAGARAFCGGVDVREATALSAEAAGSVRSQRLFDLLLALAACPKPVIAAVNGAASGGGAMLALLGDRVIAVEGATLSMPEIDLGSPTLAGMAILAHTGGNALAADLVQTGRRMSAAEALARGLYAEVVAADALAARAEAAARMLGSKSAAAFRLNKQWLRKPLVEALRLAEADTRQLRADGTVR